MDALVNQINQLRVIIEEYRAFLLTNTPSRGRNGNAWSRGTLTATEELHASSTEEAADQMKERIPFMVPVMVLVQVKLLVDSLLDNSIAGAAVMMSLIGWHALKQGFESELALPYQSRKSNLSVLLLCSVVLLSVVLFKIRLFNYTGSVWDRLAFQSLPNDRPYSLLETLWSCGITDMIMQLMILTVKMVVLKGVGGYTQFEVAATNGANDDLERGLRSRLSSLCPNLAGLPRLQTSVGRENCAYLLKARLCALVDALGLVYRTALPITWWVAYLRSTPVVVLAVAMQTVYVAVKLAEVSTKCYRVVLAVSMFLENKPEFGHYSTDEELRGRDDAPGDCPVCFDNPHRPVTLDCQHVFCEVCIEGWLQKRRTCPVCRVKVQYASSSGLRTMQAEANSETPIVA